MGKIQPILYCAEIRTVYKYYSLSLQVPVARHIHCYQFSEYGFLIVV